MKNHINIQGLLATTGFVTVMLGASSAWALEQIGVVGANSNALTAVSEDGATRILKQGDAVYLNDNLTTDKTGRAQIIFKDRSTVTINENAQLRVDTFVYDPQANTGKMTMNSVKGVFRFIGGALSKQNPVEVRTPVATIGIRGGIVDTHVEAGSGETNAVFVYGKEMTLANAAGEVTSVTKIGSGLALDKANGAPKAMTPAQVQQTTQAFKKTEGGATVGAAKVPTREDVKTSSEALKLDEKQPESPSEQGSSGQDSGGSGSANGEAQSSDGESNSNESASTQQTEAGSTTETTSDASTPTASNADAPKSAPVVVASAFQSLGANLFVDTTNITSAAATDTVIKGAKDVVKPDDKILPPTPPVVTPTPPITSGGSGSATDNLPPKVVATATDTSDNVDAIGAGGDDSVGGGEDSVGGGDGSVGGGDDSVGGGEDSVGGGEDSVGGGEDSVGGGDDSIGGGDDSVGGGEDSVGGGEDSVGGGEDSVGGGEDSVGGGEDSVGGGDDGVDVAQRLEIGNVTNAAGYSVVYYDGVLSNSQLSAGQGDVHVISASLNGHTVLGVLDSGSSTPHVFPDMGVDGSGGWYNYSGYLSNNLEEGEMSVRAYRSNDAAMTVFRVYDALSGGVVSGVIGRELSGDALANAVAQQSSGYYVRLPDVNANLTSEQFYNFTNFSSYYQDGLYIDWGKGFYSDVKGSWLGYTTGDNQSVRVIVGRLDAAKYMLGSAIKQNYTVGGNAAIESYNVLSTKNYGVSSVEGVLARYGNGAAEHVTPLVRINGESNAIDTRSGPVDSVGFVAGMLSSDGTLNTASRTSSTGSLTTVSSGRVYQTVATNVNNLGGVEFHRNVGPYIVGMKFDVDGATQRFGYYNDAADTTSNVYMNNNNYVAVNGDSSAFVVAGKQVDANTATNYQYTQWGVWGGEVAGSGGAKVAELVPYVVGQVTQASNLPQTGNASYSGQAYATIDNGRGIKNYKGSMNATADFSRRQIADFRVRLGNVQDAQGSNKDLVVEAKGIGLATAGAAVFSSQNATATRDNVTSAATVNGALFGLRGEEIAGDVEFNNLGGMKGAGIFQGKQ